MSKRDDVPQFYKDRIAAHLRAYCQQRQIIPAELERRLGVRSGTGTRLLKAQRLGLGVFIRIALLPGMGGADYLLFEPPKPKVGQPKKG